MVNNRQKMYITNSKIRKYLIENNYLNVRFFPHLRFQKDLDIDGYGFDGMCTKNNRFVLFQAKTNLKPSKKIIESYRTLARKYTIRCVMLTAFDNKGVILFE